MASSSSNKRPHNLKGAFLKLLEGHHVSLSKYKALTGCLPSTVYPFVQQKKQTSIQSSNPRKIRRQSSLQSALSPRLYYPRFRNQRTPKSTANMSVFARNVYGSDASFTPLFRLLDDFDSYRSELQGENQQEGRSRRSDALSQPFTPKFDIRETATAYELHGELPGVDRDNVSIEFTDAQTMVIRGSVERSYTAGTPPAGLVRDTKTGSAITEKGDEHATTTTPQKATVEDDDETTKKGSEASELASLHGSSQAMKRAEAPKQQQQQRPAEKYWVMERSIGEFLRTVNFQSRVDQDAVTARIDNGILSVTVPKAKKPEVRRIAIN
ncbi:HSP20-like chaperone [Bombardia bombarda]|uniref:HSP20-like chaperone n=1 Tax=Bombardia bombarda TaxID=252184 RepID=A0AA40C782_9PEZI|nr:HSP20-like chaperone [Bombardia bombarda]